MKVLVMRTTVTLDEKLVKELMKFTDAKTKTAAVAIAVKDQIRRAKLKKLADFLGTVATAHLSSTFGFPLRALTFHFGFVQTGNQHLLGADFVDLLPYALNQ